MLCVCAVVLGAVLCFLCCAADNRTGQDLKLKGGFRTRGVKQDGTPHWELQGDECLLRGVHADLKGVNLVFFPDTTDEVTMTSPGCSFDTTTSVATSDAELKVEGRGMTLTGIGYRIVPQQQKLLVRRRVRMTIRSAKRAVDILESNDGSKQVPENTDANKQGKE